MNTKPHEPRDTNHETRTTRHGFTLIELMVASAILLTFLGASLLAFNSVFKNANYSQGVSLASSACRGKLEEIVSHNFTSIITDYSAGGTPGNTFDFNTSAVVGITGKGNIVITDRRDLYGGGENLATATAAWLGRWGHASVVYDNRMWVMGGWSSSGNKNDVWYSTDGINWNQATASAAWSPRRHLTSIVYNNKMWVMGGWDGTVYKNDVWYSGDGINWIQATASAAWSARYAHTSLAYDNKMWVMGGYTGTVYKNDVWYSTDGINWNQATASAAWSARFGHASVVYDNKMWVMGGYSPPLWDDVWYSTNGVNWTLATAHAGWPLRYYYTSLVYDNKMWIMGGLGSGGSYLRDIWCSNNGVNWSRATASAAWTARENHTSLAYNNKMWIIGGNDGSNKRDVWYSTGYNRSIEALITVSWRQADGRIFGEDTNLNGVLNAGEDRLPANGHLDSPAQLRVYLSEESMNNLQKTFLGRP